MTRSSFPWPNFKQLIIAAVVSIVILAALMVRTAHDQRSAPSEDNASPPVAGASPSPSELSSDDADGDIGPPAIDGKLLATITGFETAVWTTRYDETAEARAARLAPYVAATYIDPFGAPTGDLGATQAQLASTTNQSAATASITSPSDINVSMLAQSVATATVTVTRHTTDATGYDSTDTVSDTVYLRLEDGTWRVRINTPTAVTSDG